ncbi:TPA: hypothetical protein SI540_004588 [Escherichia coli]|nr:hypothetical protein [Escherichia coli]HEI2488331.1 hypothetical protein [Escherichia coli]HEI2493871.1 hypothetical protein [Escherichia coli]HEI2555882.1 hypothetical protein [Escherichia coli]HEI2570398.1 hypothetical protein [Escherichia coli]
MKLTQYFRITVLFAGVLSFQSSAETVGTLRSAIYVNYVPPTCSITVPSAVDLGNKKPGSYEEKSKINLSINCQSPVRTSLRVIGIKGSLVQKGQGQGLSFINSQGQDSGNAIFLELLNDNLQFRYWFDGSTQGCEGEQNRTCIITPIVHAFSNTGGNFAYGKASNAVRFELVYS